MSGGERYTQEDAEQILRIASRATGEGVSRERLLEMAAELGISTDEVLAAERQVQAEKGELRDRQEFDRHQRRSFFGHLTSYVIVNAFLVGMNFMTDHSVNWAIWSILGWGIGLAFHAASTFFRNSQDYEEEFQKWRALRQAGVPAADRKGPIVIGVHINAPSAAGVAARPADLRDRLEALVLTDNLTKIEAIRRVRDATGASLRDAKDAVDAFDRENPGVIRG